MDPQEVGWIPRMWGGCRSQHRSIPALRQGVLGAWDHGHGGAVTAQRLQTHTELSRAQAPVAMDRGSVQGDFKERGLWH